MMQIKVNGIPYEYEGDRITYTALVRLAGYKPIPLMRVSYTGQAGNRHEIHLQFPPIKMFPGMLFTVEPRT